MLGWVLKPLAVASTAVISTLGLLSRKYQRARLYYHLGLYLSTLGAASAWGVLITIVATLTGKVSVNACDDMHGKEKGANGGLG